MDDREYGPPREDELEAYAALINRCFGQWGELDEARAWIRKVPRTDLRTLREGGRPVAALTHIAMGQVFGGRAVPSAGVAGVGIEPDRRGQGLARELMGRYLLEQRAAGTPLSTLYASTFALYRSLGYERAGARWVARLRPAELPVRADAAPMRPVTADDEPTLEAVWEAWSRLHPGNLARDAYLWGRVRAPRDKPTQAVLVEGDGGVDGVEGYVRWMQLESEVARDGYDLAVTDVAALTPRAARRILAFFAGHGSLAGEVRWATGPGDPLLALLPERRFALELRDEWMLRVLDVPGALAARGYPAGAAGEVHLAVEDGLAPENAGPWVLSVAEGRGRAERGGEGRLRASVRGLAALYSGYRAARQLALAGWLEGDEASLAAADLLFAGPSPWMADNF
jgi:predicted acetyltransferase